MAGSSRMTRALIGAWPGVSMEPRVNSGGGTLASTKACPLCDPVCCLDILSFPPSLPRLFFPSSLLPCLPFFLRIFFPSILIPSFAVFFFLSHLSSVLHWLLSLNLKNRLSSCLPSSAATVVNLMDRSLPRYSTTV